MTTSISTVDVIISSVVCNYLKKVDKKLAEDFKQKTNCLTLSQGSPEIHDVFNHFIKTNRLSKKIKLNAVDYDSDDEVEEEEHNEGEECSKKEESNQIEDCNEKEEHNKKAYKNTNATIEEQLHIAGDSEEDSEEESSFGSEELNGQQVKQESFDSNIVKDLDNVDADNDINDDFDDQPQEKSFNEYMDEEPSEHSDFSPRRGRGGFGNRGRHFQGRGRHEGRDRSFGGNFRGGSRGGFRGRSNDRQGGRGRGRGRGGDRGGYRGQKRQHGGGSFNNRQSNEYNNSFGSKPQGKKIKLGD